MERHALLTLRRSGSFSGSNPAACLDAFSERVKELYEHTFIINNVFVSHERITAFCTSGSPLETAAQPRSHEIISPV